MDHIMQLEHRDLRYCNPDIARIRKSSSILLVVFALATIAFLSLFLSFPMRTTLSSALSAQLLAIASFVMTKKALFFLSNVIFLFLAADYRCFFTIFNLSPSTSDVTACEPIGVLAKQAQPHQEVQQCVIQSCVPYSGSLDHNTSNHASENYAHPAKEDVEESMGKARTSDNTTPSEEQEEQEDVPVSSQLEQFMLDQEANSAALEKVVVEEPACGTAQELEKLELDELNKKFEEFIQSRRTKWMKEEAYLQWQQEEALQWQQEV